MGSVRQRRKAKSNVKKVTRRTKDKARNINIASNPIIEKNWDYNLTLKQNYKRLGLVGKLQRPAGGIEASLEKPVFKHQGKQGQTPVEEINDEDLTEDDIPEGEARIIRDGNGEVLRVIYGKKKPLSEDLELLDTPVEVEEAKTEVVKQLEAYAARPIAPKERTQSEREVEWLERLYNKYGDDYARMKWDKKLNIYQQSEGDLRRRILKWKKKNGIN